MGLYSVLHNETLEGTTKDGKPVTFHFDGDHNLVTRVKDGKEVGFTGTAAGALVGAATAARGQKWAEEVDDLAEHFLAEEEKEYQEWLERKTK